MADSNLSKDTQKRRGRELLRWGAFLLLTIFFMGALVPLWTYSNEWGYTPLAIGVFILVIIAFLGLGAYLGTHHDRRRPKGSKV